MHLPLSITNLCLPYQLLPLSASLRTWHTASELNVHHCVSNGKSVAFKRLLQFLETLKLCSSRAKIKMADDDRNALLFDFILLHDPAQCCIFVHLVVYV